MNYAHHVWNCKNLQRNYTLSVNNQKNLWISLNLISNFPPVDFMNNDCWNDDSSNKKYDAYKLHIKYSLLLNFYVLTFNDMLDFNISKQHPPTPLKTDFLRIFSTRRTGAIYTFTRAPIAHKKHSRVQYQFICFHVKMSVKHTLVKQLVACNATQALISKDNLLKITRGLDSNLSSLQRLRISYFFCDTLTI